LVIANNGNLQGKIQKSIRMAKSTGIAYTTKAKEKAVPDNHFETALLSFSFFFSLASFIRLPILSDGRKVFRISK
jgi:hypothetical protein